MTTERALVDLFHYALDAEDVAGPFQRLQLELDRSTGAASRRRARRTFMTPNRIAVLAAALIAILTAGILVGTRLYNDSRNHSAVPATSVADLLARPLKLPSIEAGQKCPDGPYSQGGLGNGPVHALSGTESDSSWGSYAFVPFRTDPGLQGPIIVRGKDLVTGSPVIFLGQYGIGPVKGSDTVDGQAFKQYEAVELDPGHKPASHMWSIYEGLPHGNSGCVGTQVDGPGFTEVFYP